MKGKHNKETEIPINSDDSNEDITNEDIANEEIEENEISGQEDSSPSAGKQLAELKDQYLRKSAEFENYKKRTEAEKADYFAYANEKLIGDLLPVLDDFERALKSFNEKHDAESLKKGVELINDRFRKILEKRGLKEMNTSGKDFDVHLHEALMQQPSDKIAPNKIIDTVEKGYHLKDKVLRHAKVVVSAKPE
jgi:molecular chaperone GrpE